MTKTKEGSFSTSIWMNLQSVYTRQITTRNVSHSKSFAKIHLLKLEPDSYCLLIRKFLQCSLERHSKSTCKTMSLGSISIPSTPPNSVLSHRSRNIVLA